LNNTFDMSHNSGTCEIIRAIKFYLAMNTLRSSRSCVNGPQPAPWPTRTIRCALDNLDKGMKIYKSEEEKYVLYIVVP
jgi:hypothetical protein